MSFPKRKKPEKKPRPATGGAPRAKAEKPARPTKSGKPARPPKRGAKVGRRDADSKVVPDRKAGARPARRDGPSKVERRVPAKGERSDERKKPPVRNTGRRGASRFGEREPADVVPEERAVAAPTRNPKRVPFVLPPRVISTSQLSSEPHPGQYLLTTREGSEQDLVDELRLLKVVDPPARVIAPAIVLAPKIPKRDKRPVELTFARQGFPIVQSVKAHDIEEITARVGRSLRGQLERAKTYALHVWVPDSTLGNPLASLAEELREKLEHYLDKALPESTRVDDAALRRLGSLPLAQVCLLDTERAVAGVAYSNAVLSLAPGGRTRVRVTGNFPSRAARKLEEALAWLGVEPGPGELCVDLGAAPGGWTYVLAERRARVIAVDPAKLRPEILAKKGVSHVQQSAFTYKPDAEVDWLFCDMAWRPLEAAGLLAKWGRNRWSRMLIANIKLPMTKKAELLARVKHILETEGDWKHVRTKQLYHDRDEITLTAHVG